MSTGPSRLSTDSVAPSAAATIGIVTVQCRSSPCRSKIGCGRCDDLQEQVTGRPAAGADLALAGQLDVRPVLDAGRDRAP